MGEVRAGPRPLRAAAMLGIVVGMFMVIGGALALFFALAGAMLSAFGPSGSGAGVMLSAVLAAIALGLVRLKLSIVMFGATEVSRLLCLSSALCSGACVFVLLLPGSPGSLTIGLLALAVAEAVITLWIMLREPRRRASEAELERLKVEGRVEL